MKTVTLSNRFYYSELNEQDAQAIQKDIVLYNRMLHKAYKMLSLKNKGLCIKSRCIKEKVSVKEINPAYTSRIAKDKYMKSMGCSVHMAASYVITRRGCGYIDII